MAEFVQFRAEEWASELAQMERIGLFDPNEIKSIVRKRKEFEYKIQRRTKVMEDFLKYIQFEIDLHRIIKARRKKNRIKTNRQEIEFSQTRRIGNLFKFALRRFPNDVKLWMSFFKFCKSVKFYTLVSQMLVRMLKIHSNKPELWVFAAKWEYEQCDSIGTARQFLTRGLRHHPSNPVLYKELFALELENRQRLLFQKKRRIIKISENDQAKKNIIRGTVAEVVYESALKEIKDVEFKVEMFEIAKSKKAPQYLKYAILESMVMNHLDEELTWNVAAQVRILLFPSKFKTWIEKKKKMEEENEGGKVEKRKNEDDEDKGQEKRMKMDEEKNEEEIGVEVENKKCEVNEEKSESETKVKESVDVEKEKKKQAKVETETEDSEEKKEEKCEKADIEANTEMEVEVEKNKEEQKEEPENVKSLTTKERIQISIDFYEEAVKRFNSEKMWSFYLDFVIKLNKNLRVLKVFKTKLFNNAMEGAMKSGKMAEEYYIAWIQHLQKSKTKTTPLSEILKKGTEDHPKSVKLWYARLKFTLTQNSETEGLEIFNKAIENIPDAAPLWSIAVKYLLSKSSPKTEEMLQNGINKGGEVAQVLKPFYIEWLVKTKGMTEARIAFESAEMNLYPCLELYKKMAELELNEDPPCLEKVRKCYDLACKHFGEDDPDVWLDYIKFELNRGEISKVAKTHSRALKHLKPEPADEFLAEYNKFKMEVST